MLQGKVRELHSGVLTPPHPTGTALPACDVAGQACDRFARGVKEEICREGNIVQLVEQHCISRSDPRYSVIDEAAFKSKNLYNAALYEMRQAFIHQSIYLSFECDTFSRNERKFEDG